MVSLFFLYFFVVFVCVGVFFVCSLRLHLCADFCMVGGGVRGMRCKGMEDSLPEREHSSEQGPYTQANRN